MTTYAGHTKVSVQQTKADIGVVLAKYGGHNLTIHDHGTGMAVVFFQAHGRYLRFNLPLPSNDPQHLRSAWRALLLTIRAKLQSSESGIEAFDEAFLAQIIPSSDFEGQTIGEQIIPTLPPRQLTQEKTTTVPCPHCGVRNRIPHGRNADRAKCGSCGKSFSEPGTLDGFHDVGF